MATKAWKQIQVPAEVHSKVKAEAERTGMKIYSLIDKRVCEVNR